MIKVKLKEVAKFSKGQQINGDKLTPDGKFAFLNGGVHPSGRWISYNVEGSTIAISEGGNSSGFVNYMDDPFWCGAHCYYLFDCQYDSKYLFFALKSQQDRIMQLRSGACMPNIKKNDLAEFEFNIDRDTSKQVVVKKTLEKLSSLIYLRKQQLVKLDELVKARFVEMFGDVIHNTCGWPVHTFSDIASSRLGKMLDRKQQTGRYRFPYLANFNVQWFHFEISSLNQMDFDEADQQEFALIDGDLLVCEGGEIGRCAVWHNEVQPCFFQKALHRVRCNRDIILPDYLVWWFKYNCDHGGFSAIKGAKATIAHLPGTKLKMLPVVVPPMDKQRSFSTFIEQIGKSRLTIQQSLAKLELLKKALMQEYFG